MQLYMVMSATTYDGTSTNKKRCFPLNAVNIPTMEEAQRIAKERNAAEKAAGHNNVEWFPVSQ